MIDFKEHKLENGLRVVLHQDKQTPSVVVNVLYDVGSRDESEYQTGFAHLFEHLMFGGSRNAPNFDTEIQKVGGMSNAFTSPDITNYYISVPSFNVETALWLESDRMLNLIISQKTLDIQKKVVVEEFKQRYLNRPYGDIWHLLRPLAYRTHPYKWPTIGQKTEHISEAKLEDVQNFYQKFYNPNNAVLCVAGNFEYDKMLSLVEKWFGDIKPGAPYFRSLPQEAPQKEARTIEHKAKVSHSAIYKTYHIAGRREAGFYPADLLSDILGRGKSSRLFEQLVKKEAVFNQINAYITGSVDPGLLVVSGKVNDPQRLEEANNKVEDILASLCATGPTEKEVFKVKNQSISSLSFSGVGLLNRAMRLAYCSTFAAPSRINNEKGIINSVNASDIHGQARHVLSEANSSTLYYVKE